MQMLRLSLISSEVTPLDLSGENDRFAVAKDALRLLLGGSKAKRFS